jgi:hypothetical protein
MEWLSSVLQIKIIYIDVHLIYYECIIIISNGDFYYIFRALRSETDGFVFCEYLAYLASNHYFSVNQDEIKFNNI